jgi:nitrate reductase gamma subunit
MEPALHVEPDLNFVNQMMSLGAHDVKKCVQCATCTSVCTLSSAHAGFPRKQMLLTQWGQREQLLADPGPWLCFYCGECSKDCLRKANPGETMMALRRYLTSQYDWTGLSRLMYRSAAWEIGILALVGSIIALLFTLPSNFGFGLLSRSGPQALSTVMLNKFAPVEMVHLADTTLALLLGFFLLTNAARMFRSLTRNDNISVGTYIRYLPTLVGHLLTQARWKGCVAADATKNWLRHLLLASGYMLMFTLVVIFLPWFQVPNDSIHWTSFLGYYATAVLLVGSGWMILDRVRKHGEMYRFSHLSDWLFPILLLLTAATGILMHILRVENLAMPTYVMYTIHLSVAVPMLVVEVPFGKWAHLLYRPVAIYVDAVRKDALAHAA